MFLLGSGAVGTSFLGVMNPQSGNAGGLTYHAVFGFTYSPCIAAKNHQLAGSSSERLIIFPTAFAYHSRSGFLKSPPLFHAFLRMKLAISLIGFLPYQS